MKIIKPLILFLVIHIAVSNAFAEIKNYETFISYINYKNKDYIVIRKFTSDKQNHYLAVNPDNLKTIIIKDENLKKTNWKFIENKFKNTKYIKLLTKSKKNNSKLQNSGIISFDNKTCIYLTTDLCPSKKNLEKDFYTSLSKYTKHPIPVGIAISGKWMEKHSKELDFLLNLEKKKKILITWVNHSYNHKYYKKKPLEKNFMLSEGTNLKEEILRLEKLLMEKELTPSIYFRFPGLVSNKKVFDYISNYGLIVLGSNAWIAKDQYPTPGSIVLLHGNGNEHIGIVTFEKFLKKDKNICFEELGE
jgi:peptidoglycan/xylan/chitin deacetylase (PgdA/CDA1 family)